MVSPSKQIYKCFGCGSGGDVITFVQNKELLTFHETIKHLCEKNSISYDFTSEVVDEVQIKRERERLIIGYADTYFKSVFKESEAEVYSKSVRGYSDSIISMFGLSFAPNGFSNLYNHLLGISVSATEMESCALIKKHDTGGNYYDCFRNRLMFPICDKFGKVIAFSGRALKENQKPKYYNSAETDIFKKSHVLYGLHLAKEHISKSDSCIVVEGATDVIAMHIKGLCNSVATLGTAFTPEHAKLIKAYTKNVTLLYDGDSAGLKAVFRGCQVLFKEGLFVKVCQLPIGQDPDTFFKGLTKEDSIKFIEDNSKDFIVFRLSLLSESISDKVKVSKELVSMINDFPDHHARSIMRLEYERLLGLKSELMFTPKVVQHNIYNTNPELNLLRVALTVDHDFVYKKFLDLPDLYTYFQDDKLGLLAKETLLNADYDIHKAMYSEDESIRESAQQILNCHTPYVESDWDVDYHIAKFELHIMSVIEKQIFGGISKLDESKQSAMLTKIKIEKKKVLSDVEILESERKKDSLILG